MGRSDKSVNLREIAHIQFIYQREIHLGIFDVQMPLQVAGVFHCKDHFVFIEVVLAEDIESVFVEVAVESGADLADLAFDDPS